MKYYIESIKMHLKSTLEYKTSFILAFISQFLVFFTYYFIIIALFNKFSNIKGFTVYEVLLTFSIITFGFSVNEFLARGVDTFDNLIIDGSFDRLLLRPRNILLQVLCSNIDFVKLSRVIQSLVVFIISINSLNIEWNSLRIIIFSIFLLMASYCFITVQGLEIRNLFTDGGKNIAKYPMGIYKKGVLLFFTFIIPYAFVNYYPLLYLLGKSTKIIYAFSPLIVLLYLIPAFISFKIGINKYTSAGS